LAFATLLPVGALQAIIHRNEAKMIAGLSHSVKNKKELYVIA
jgi:hypothetical protein